MADCIVAVATPHINSIHHIIRGSGRDAHRTIEKTLAINIIRNTEYKMQNIKYNNYDLTIYVFFEPNSYTGENMFEIHFWGNFVIANNILKQLITCGARYAKEGEFTQRAFLNGKKNFIELEQIANLFDSVSIKTIKISNSILESKTYEKKFKEIYNLLLNIISELEATWDFVEHDITPIDTNSLYLQLKKVNAYLQNILNSLHYTDTNFKGYKIAIWGLSNVGKSYIFKRLTGYNSIISNIKGTTRDIISATKNYCNKTFTFLDLPGYDIVFKNDIEKLSSELAQNIIPQVDGIIFVFDLATENFELELSCYEKVKQKMLFVIGNKQDIANPKKLQILQKRFDKNSLILTSALKNQGFGNLLRKLSSRLTSYKDECSNYIVTLRQFQILQEIKKSLNDAISYYEQSVPMDLIVDELKYSLQNFDSLFGTRLDEEILTSIMSKFCIGK